jgi:aminoglycoside phosphotransferase (APT) family kinase protein
MPAADLLVPVRRALEAAWGAPVALGEPERLGKRDHVVRLPLRVAPTATSSVVVKAPRVDGFRQFASEWSALEALGATTRLVAPRLLAASVDPPFLVMEDVGGSPSLASLLLGTDRAAASAALVNYAEGIADLHAVGIAQVDAFEQRMRDLGCTPMTTRYETAFPVGTNDVAWRALLDQLGIDEPAVDADLDVIAAAIAEPGAYRGIVHGDPCPDNVRLVGDRLRVYDFEYASIGHVLLDAAYLSVPFPTCWCVASLPPPLVTRANAAYRERLAIADAAAWDRELALACAAWLVATVPRQIDQARDANPTWGITTVRERIAGRLGRFVDRATAVDELPVLTETMRKVRDLLVDRWPHDDTVLRAYPAFAEAGERVAGPPDWWSETA